MSINPALFSSKTDMWATPQDFFDRLNDEFDFELDVCALPSNTKCKKFYTPSMDGLKQDWAKDAKSIWMNPPYGRTVQEWIKKAYDTSLEGATVVCLLPVRPDTKYWHEYCMKGEIRFVKGRLKFGNAKNVAPFGSAVVIFGSGARIGTLSAM
ncbi:DNA N-6-adenine-methyltransferase [Paenibacillus oryzisoli]|uniref:DNA N-6-adenine-methyltransferase n=1 Tax=Paenibacillus oryzisoli TaxID=1850517 RepID=UPI003D2AF81C